MRIFCAVRHSLDPAHYYGDLWSRNFYPALRRLGHEIVESQTDLLAASRFMHVAADFGAEGEETRAAVTEKILEEVRAAHAGKPIDLFLSYFYNSHFDPDAFNELQRIGIPAVNFYCNSLYQFELVSAVARKVSFSWHTERNAGPLYKAVGARPVWVQMGAEPELTHAAPAARRQSKACFVGQRYADRDRMLAKLLGAGVPVDIYGSGWRSEPCSPPEGARPSGRPGAASYAAVILENFRTQGLVAGAARTLRQAAYRRQSRRLDGILEKAARGYAKDSFETFARYEVVLNFSNVWADGRPGSALIPHARLRDFEAPMSGACYLTGHVDELEECYKFGEEIDCYRSGDELVEKTKFYLAHPDSAEKLRQAGQRRARSDHTWDQRFRLLFHKIDLDD